MSVTMKGAVKTPAISSRRRISGFEVMYLSAGTATGFRDSRGYEILREKAYEAQRCGYALNTHEEKHE